VQFLALPVPATATATPQPAQPTTLSFTLVNANTDQDLVRLTNGITIPLGTVTPNQLSIRADAAGSAVVKSVRFTVRLPDGTTRNQDEQDIPFALCGGTPTDYNACVFLAYGTYTLTATPYTDRNFTQQIGDPVTIQFTLTS
jgi:hypothetical protein